MTEFHDSAHKERGEVMDLMEQIRLEADKFLSKILIASDGFVYSPADIPPTEAFQAGAYALLNLLGRSATSEGHPPRIMMTYKVGGRPQVSTHPRMDCENHEYLSRKEHQALRAADLLEIERAAAMLLKQAETIEQLREELKFLQAENEVFGIAAEKYGDLSCCYDAEDVCCVVKTAFEEQAEELSQEREARKADAAELEKWKWEYDNLCKFATDFEDQLAVEREARKGDSAEIESACKAIESWKAEAIRQQEIGSDFECELIAERARNARLTAALVRLQSTGSLFGKENLESAEWWLEHRKPEAMAIICAYSCKVANEALDEAKK